MPTTPNAKKCDDMKTGLDKKDDLAGGKSPVIPPNLRQPDLTFRDYNMRFDNMFWPPESPPVAKFTDPPVSDAPLSPNGHHYILPSNSDELCGRALRKRTDANKWTGKLKWWRNFVMTRLL